MFALGIHDSVFDRHGQLRIPAPLNPNTGLRTVNWREQIAVSNLSDRTLKAFIYYWFTPAGLRHFERKGRSKGLAENNCDLLHVIEVAKQHSTPSVVMQLQSIKDRFQPLRPPAAFGEYGDPSALSKKGSGKKRKLSSSPSTR